MILNPDLARLDGGAPFLFDGFARNEGLARAAA